MNPSTDPHRVDLDSRGGEIFGIAKLVRAYRSDDVKSSSRRRSRASW